MRSPRWAVAGDELLGLVGMGRWGSEREEMEAVRISPLCRSSLACCSVPDGGADVAAGYPVRPLAPAWLIDGVSPWLLG